MSKYVYKQGWYTFGRFLCRLFCVLFFRIDIQGMEKVPKKGPFLLICNHQSFLDPIFCAMHLKRFTYFLARDSLFKNKIFAWIISSVNTIPVKRGKADVTAMKKIIRRLKMGHGLCLFPEGTRSLDGRIAEFKPGFELLARKTKAVIIPVVIDGAYECWPKERPLFKPWHKIMVRYGEPMAPEEIKQYDSKELAEKLTKTVRELQNKCRKKELKEVFNYDDC